jgi:hypothetical protein
MIKGLDGQPLESEESIQKRQEAAIAQFEAMMKKMDEERIPLEGTSSEAKVQEIASRAGIISSLIKLTYSHPLTRTKGNETQGRSVEITGTVDMPLLDNQQIAILGLRLFELVKLL